MNFNFSQLNYKKIILVSGFVLVCVGLTFLMYLMFFKSTPENINQNQNNILSGGNLPIPGENTGLEQIGTGGNLPYIPSIDNYGNQIDQIANGGITMATSLNSGQVLNPKLASDGKSIIYYDINDQRFYLISEDGEKILLSSEKFLNLEAVEWSPDASRAIMTYPDGIKIYYDFASNKKTTLPKNVVEPVFNTTGSNISFKYETEDKDKNYITVSKPDGTGAKLVEPLGDKGEAVQTTFSPDTSVIAFYEKPTGLDSAEIYFIGQNDENFPLLKIQGVNFKGIWSPSGKKIIYNTTMASIGYRPNLWIVGILNGNLGNAISLDTQTWVDKCVFAGENDLYCAVPDSLPTGAGLYPEIIENETDSIYHISLSTGIKEKIADIYLDDGATNFNIGRMSISSDGASLFLWDKISGKMFKMRLR
jgi:Tol biopolymer transport system component